MEPRTILQRNEPLSQGLKWLFFTIVSSFIMLFWGEDLSVGIFCSKIVFKRRKGTIGESASVVQHTHPGIVQINMREKVSSDVNSLRSKGYEFPE